MSLTKTERSANEAEKRLKKISLCAEISYGKLEKFTSFSSQAAHLLSFPLFAPSKQREVEERLGLWAGFEMERSFALMHHTVCVLGNTHTRADTHKQMHTASHMKHVHINFISIHFCIRGRLQQPWRSYWHAHVPSLYPYLHSFDMQCVLSFCCLDDNSLYWQEVLFSKNNKAHFQCVMVRSALRHWLITLASCGRAIWQLCNFTKFFSLFFLLLSAFVAPLLCCSALPLTSFQITVSRRKQLLLRILGEFAGLLSRNNNNTQKEQFPNETSGKLCN